MSMNYFTGCNLNAYTTKVQGTAKTGYPTSRYGGTKLTAFGLCETEPSANEGGLTPKGQGHGNVYVRLRKKVYTKTTDSHGKSFANYGVRPGNSNTRANGLGGAKYDLAKMWKYRKTLKKTLDNAVGTTTNKGCRNMYTNKGAGHTGTKHSKPAAAQQVYWPMDQGK
jgi:hypothetical protein